MGMIMAPTLGVDLSVKHLERHPEESMHLTRSSTDPWGVAGWTFHHGTRLPLEGHVAMSMWMHIRSLPGKPCLAVRGTRDAQTIFSNHHQVKSILREQESGDGLAQCS